MGKFFTWGFKSGNTLCEAAVERTSSSISFLTHVALVSRRQGLILLLLLRSSSGPEGLSYDTSAFLAQTSWLSKLWRRSRILMASSITTWRLSNPGMSSPASGTSSALLLYCSGCWVPSLQEAKAIDSSLKGMTCGTLDRSRTMGRGERTWQAL